MKVGSIANTVSQMRRTQYAKGIAKTRTQKRLISVAVGCAGDGLQFLKGIKVQTEELPYMIDNIILANMTVNRDSGGSYRRCSPGAKEQRG